MGQPVVHFEVMGQDGEKLRSYYSELFGWKIDAGNPMGYGIVSREENLGPDGEGIAGGVGQMPEGQPGTAPSTWACPTRRPRWQRRRASAGRGCMGPEEIMGSIVIGLFNDPEGNLVGVVQT